MNIPANFTRHFETRHSPTVDSITDLGVTYDNRLSFSLHIDKIVTKASLRAKLILNCFQSRDPHLLVNAFCTFVRFSNTVVLDGIPGISMKLTKLKLFSDVLLSDYEVFFTICHLDMSSHLHYHTKY